LRYLHGGNGNLPNEVTQLEQALPELIPPLQK